MNDMPSPLVQSASDGLYCEAGDFYIDPWNPVERAVITHAHADHAQAGCGRYLTAAAGETVLRARIGPAATIDTLPYGAAVEERGVRISFHPAGHVLGSAQVRLEHGGRIWVVSGDYKLAADRTCAGFEPVQCEVFLTESTFGLPIYRWPPAEQVFAEIADWWRTNQEKGKASLLYCYALGKAQRILANIDTSVGPIYTHGAVEKITQAYRESSIPLPPTMAVREAPAGTDWTRGLILAPPSAHGTPWMRRFGALSTGFASGWMLIRGTRRRRAVDRGFVLSDHVDWPGLQEAVRASGARELWVTHGQVAPVVHWFAEQGLETRGLQTRYEGELADTGREEEE
jgi:putative mRNA 3-end processing factor